MSSVFDFARSISGSKNKVVAAWTRGRHAVVVACIAALAIFIGDLFVPPTISVWFFYLIPVALTYQASHRATPFLLAGLCTTLLVGMFFLDTPGVALVYFFINSSINLSLIWATAAVVVQLKRSEDRLLQSVSLLNATLESTADGILVIGLRGEVISHNQRFLRMWNIPASFEERSNDNQLLAFVLDQLKEPDEFLEKVKHLYSQPLAFSNDTIEFKDGRFFERCSQPQILGEEVVGRVWCFRDITGQQQTENELKHTNERLELVARCNNDALWDWDLVSGRMWWNETFYSFYGHTLNMLPSQEAWLSHVHPEEREFVNRKFVNALNDGVNEWADDFRYLRADGTYGDVVGRMVVQRCEGGTPIRILGSLLDVTARKQAQERLETERNMLRTVIDNLPDRIYVKDTQCRFLLNNVAHMDALGVRAQNEALGKTDFEFRPQELAKNYHADDQHVIQSGKALFNREEHTTLPSGAQGWLLTTKVPLKDSHGVVTGLVGISRDITARRQAQESLQRSEERYHSLFDTVPVGIYQSTLEGKYLTVNREMVRILGYATSEELMDATTDLHKEFYVRSGRRAEFVSRIRQEGVVSGFESQAYRKDRSIIWVSENARALFDEQGVLSGFEGIATEITARKKADESTQRLLQAVEQTDDIVLMTDATGKITYTNPAYERVYGFSREETYGATPRLVKSELQNAQAYAELWNAILSGRKIRLELVNKAKDGRLVTVDSTVGPVFDSSLGLTGFIAVQRDITAQKKNEEERGQLEMGLFQAQKMESIGTLAGGVAHDFNNMLAIILGHADLLAKLPPNAERQAKSIETIAATVKRGSELVKQILMFARKSETKLAELNVNEMVPEIQTMIQETFPRTINILTKLEAGLPLIKADPTQVHQTLLNLCVNARDAMPEGGTLFISTSRVTIDQLRQRVPDAQGKAFVKTSIRDTGTGIDEATKARLFEPFFTTKGPGKGTGLGLSVVYGIVKSHGGYIDVQSVPGKGTSFDCYFPTHCQMPATTERLPGTPEEAGRGTETILVVEDESMLRELLRTSLEAKGYTVLTAADGMLAVQLYKEHHMDIALVISDIGLPKMDGTKVFVELKKINPAVKVLISSGYIDPEVRSGFLKAGARGFLLKPCTPSEILKRVREVLDMNGFGTTSSARG